MVEYLVIPAMWEAEVKGLQRCPQAEIQGPIRKVIKAKKG
jgi:hypothetical protein